MEKLRVFEAFCGYGSQALALERLAEDFPEFSFEVVGVSDIDPYPLQAYQALHGHCPNYGDISKIDWDKVPDFDLFTYSFPCVDISGAGQQQGFAEGSGTRSSLLWECRKAILAKKPKYLLMENVKALVSKKFMPLYQTWLDWLEVAGYKSKWAIMNAKDFGVAQNRKRVYCWSCLEIEDYYSFVFPESFELTQRLKDALDAVVDEKYYIRAEKVKAMLADCDYKFYRKLTTQTTTGNPQVIQVGNLYPDTDKFKNRTMGRVYSTDGICPTINCCGGGDREPKILEREFFGFGRSRNKKGKVVSRYLNDYVNCIHAQVGSGRDNMQVLVAQLPPPLRIRKLTPRECFRLMGVRDKDIDKIQAYPFASLEEYREAIKGMDEKEIKQFRRKHGMLSDTRQYRMAGNSIVENCLYLLLKNAFITKAKPKAKVKQLTIFDVL